MNKDNYVVYHSHTDLSNLTAGNGADSVTKFEDYYKKASELGMSALAISEHGSVMNWVKKKETAEKLGLKYIHANEIYLTKNIDFKDEFVKDVARKRLGVDKEVEIFLPHEENHEEKENVLWLPNDYKTSILTPDDVERANLDLERDNYHFMTIAKNYDGVLELNELTSKSFVVKDGHSYFNPRFTLEELKNTSDNIIMTSACLASPLWQMSKVINGLSTRKGHDDPDYIRKVKQEYEELMQFFINNKHRMFLEIQYHNHPEQIQFNRALYDLSKETGIPLIAGTDTHALNAEHAKGREILLKAKGASYGDEDSFDLTFKNYDELVEMFEEQGALNSNAYMEAIHNTNVMADMIEEFTLDYAPKYPRMHENPIKTFKEKINEGFVERGLNDKLSIETKKGYFKRIHEEFETYEALDAVDYMLLMKDLTDWAGDRGIKFGYGRGSVNGSLVAYLLGITEMDSIEHDLYFSRFLNKDRISLADIDSDIPPSRRQEVIDHLASMEGIYFAEIITFNTIALKGAIKEAGRALDMPLSTVDFVSKQIDMNKESDMREEYPELFEAVDLLIGTIVSMGSHPSGFVVSPTPLDSHISTVYTKESKYCVTAINMKELDGLNYVKLDLLGLDNIELVNDACDLIGIDRLTPDNIDITDVDVWMSMKDSTLGVFQMESPFAHSIIKQMFSDESMSRIKNSTGSVNFISMLSMANGAIRPSGESYRNNLAQGITNDNGHEALNDLLKDTLGYLVFQEQIIEFLIKFCDHTGSEADSVRRGLSKKEGTEQYLPKIREGFYKKMKEEYGESEEHSEELLQQFLKVIEDASDYGFSKNHSDPYSFTGYACAWLRYHYPLEFLTCALNIWEDDKEKGAETMKYIKEKDIKIAPPRFGKSKSKYFLNREEQTIYKGLKSIKFLNDQMSEELFDLYHNQEFEDFVHLLKVITEETTANTRQIKILIRLGYFEEFGNDKELSAIYEKFCERFKKTHKDNTKEKRISEIREFVEELGEMSPYRINETVMFEVDNLGYPQTMDDGYSKLFGIPVATLTKYTPVVDLYIPATGKTIKIKISKKNFFDEAKQPQMRLGDLIKIKDINEKFKKTKVNNKWVETDEKELWLNTWELINRI